MFPLPRLVSKGLCHSSKASLCVQRTNHLLFAAQRAQHSSGLTSVHVSVPQFPHLLAPAWDTVWPVALWSSWWWFCPWGQGQGELQQNCNVLSWKPVLEPLLLQRSLYWVFQTHPLSFPCQWALQGEQGVLQKDNPAVLSRSSFNT